MKLFGRKKSVREKLLNLKTVNIGGMVFVLRPVNPLLDFPTDKIPQIFTDWVSARKVEPKVPDTNDLKRMQQDMYAVIQAGLDSPKLYAKSADGITVEDLFRDPTIGVKLYHLILDHSLNRFKGLKRLFFSIGIKLALLTLYADDTVSRLQVTSSPQGHSA
jgi:hypothetical protein